MTDTQQRHLHLVVPVPRPHPARRSGFLTAATAVVGGAVALCVAMLAITAVASQLFVWIGVIATALSFLATGVTMLAYAAWRWSRA